MNYKLQKNSKRLYGFNIKAKEYHDLIQGYVDTLENGNLLVYCGSNIVFFNKDLYEAIKPYVIDKDKKVLDGFENEQNYLYFYEVSPEAKERLNGIVKDYEEIKRDFWIRKLSEDNSVLSISEELKNKIEAFAKEAGSSWVFFKGKEVYFQFDQELTERNRKPNSKAIVFKDRMLRNFDFKDFHSFYDPNGSPSNTIIMLELQ